MNLEKTSQQLTPPALSNAFLGSLIWLPARTLLCYLAGETHSPVINCRYCWWWPARLGSPVFALWRGYTWEKESLVLVKGCLANTQNPRQFSHEQGSSSSKGVMMTICKEENTPPGLISLSTKRPTYFHWGKKSLTPFTWTQILQLVYIYYFKITSDSLVALRFTCDTS
jgi:hypothetical protein